MFKSYLAPAAAVLLSLLLCAPAGAAQSSAPRARHADGAIVKRGDTGGTVKKVQRALGLKADGVFGIRTARAVDAFQARAGLHRSGRVDRSTWRALFRSPVGSAGTGGEPGESGGSAPTGAEPATPAPGAPAQGGCATTLTEPIRGTRTSGFGDGRNHGGVDLAAPVGTAVLSAACGTVNVAGSQSGYGTMLCIRHSTAFVTCYAHLSSMAVSKGMVVGQAQAIGSVGMTGRTSGPHLHFETRVNGKARDPAPYLDGTLAFGTIATRDGGR